MLWAQKSQFTLLVLDEVLILEVSFEFVQLVSLLDNLFTGLFNIEKHLILFFPHAFVLIVDFTREVFLLLDSSVLNGNFCSKFVKFFLKTITLGQQLLLGVGFSPKPSFKTTQIKISDLVKLTLWFPLHRHPWHLRFLHWTCCIQVDLTECFPSSFCSCACGLHVFCTRIRISC